MSNKRILLAEDSPTQAESLRHVLEEGGYAVDWVPSAPEALAALSLRPFDLVVTDILMPGMDGFELCRAVKARAETRAVPVVLLTVLTDPEDVIRGLECGADGFVPKPYEASMLLERIEFTLENAGKAVSDAAGGIELRFGGGVHVISSTPGQIVNFLLGAYETALRKNAENMRVRQELEALNAQLESLVEERTRELREEIKERKRVHEALVRSEEQLRHAHKMEAVGQLAGGVAHDFNNLLTAINGYSELLLGMLPEDSEPREFVKMIRQSGDRASVLTRQLLAFGRRQVLAPRLVDINRSAEDLRFLLERPFGSTIRIDLQTQPGLWLTKVDPAQIEQVIMNLMLNARDAMPAGGAIRVRTANMTLEGGFTDISGEPARGEYVMIAVADEGTGIDPEVLPRIFEPFFTTKDKSKGSGLGLATAYGIVKQSHGHLQVDSAPGKGSEFRVYLPRAREAGTALPASQAAAADGVAKAELPGGTETILVAEDEEPVRALLVGILKAARYRVLEAADGDSALRMAQGFPDSIDLLLTDMTMPGLPGRDLARRLAGARPDMKVLFMSGFSEEMAVSSQDPEARADFLPKPFSALELCRKVRGILDRRAAASRPN